MHGFDGIYRPGDWTPIVVEMDNTSPNMKVGSKDKKSLKGFLSFTSMDNADSKRTFSRSFELPEFSKKRFMFYVKINTEKMQPALTILDANRKKIASKELAFNPISNDKSIILVISKEASITLPQMLVRDIYQTITIEPEYLPEVKQGLESVDIIVFPSIPETSLNEEQKRAIQLWLKDGGVIFCLGGNNYHSYKDSFLSKNLPVIPKDIEVVDDILETTTLAKSGTHDKSDAEKEKIIINNTTLNGGFPIYKINEHKLLFLKNVGLGKVYFWASDIRAFYGQRSRYFKEAWNSVFPFRCMRETENAFGMSILSAFSNIINEKMKPPSRIMIFIFLLLYMAYVAPINFYLLKKKKRLELAWITIPFIVLIFFISVYAFGLYTKGRNFYVWEFEKITAPADAKSAKQNSITKVFSPKNTTLSVSGKAENFFIEADSDRDIYQYRMPGGYSGTYQYRYQSPYKKIKPFAFLLPEKVPEHIFENNKIKISDIAMSQWSEETFVSSSYYETDNLISANLNIKDNKISGEIRNCSPSIFKDAVLIAGYSATYLGDIPPLQDKTFDSEISFIRDSNNASIRTDFDIWAKIKNDVDGKNLLIAAYNYYLFKNNPQNNAYMNMSRFSYSSNQRFCLIGWQEKQLQTVDINISQKKFIKVSFLKIPIAVNQISTDFSSKKTQAEIYVINNEEKQRNYGYGNGYEIGILEDNNLMIMASIPLEDCFFTPSSISIMATFSDRVENVEIYIYNPKAQIWDAINYENLSKPGSITAEIMNSENYVTQLNGRIFFKILKSKDNNRPNRYDYLTLNDFRVYISGYAERGIAND